MASRGSSAEPLSSASQRLWVSLAAAGCPLLARWAGWMGTINRVVPWDPSKVFCPSLLESTLHEHFSKFGPVADVYIPRDRQYAPALSDRVGRAGRPWPGHTPCLELPARPLWA